MELFKVTLEQRFNCVVCLCPRFQMVYGLCQHKMCTKCAYGSNGRLRQQFNRCPSCQKERVFPEWKPTIPEDNLEMQRYLGVTACQNEGCTQEFWSWEQDEHNLVCEYKNTPVRKHISTAGKKVSRNVIQKRRTKKTRSSPRSAYSLRSNTPIDKSKGNRNYNFRARQSL